ncbi:kanadaptin [Orussus abietinus]|uniref:kanadaptin n=1 Tax=Orussus abietinus TaxID=222816 RepID=UPI000625BBB2|nr:kanadaptin [Orussus abietinus]
MNIEQDICSNNIMPEERNNEIKVHNADECSLSDASNENTNETSNKDIENNVKEVAKKDYNDGTGEISNTSFNNDIETEAIETDRSDVKNKRSDKDIIKRNELDVAEKTSDIKIERIPSDSGTCQAAEHSVKKNEEDNQNECKELCQEQFKKPALLIGPRKGKCTKLKVVPNVAASSSSAVHHHEEQVQSHIDEMPELNEALTQGDGYTEPLVDVPKEKQLPIPYKEPPWGGRPEGEYKLEVLKSGMIIDTIDLTKKSYWLFGRYTTCDVSLAHPTISRFHAVIQYRLVPDEKNEKGFYLFDLGSTHGTFWNGYRIRPNVGVRLKGGHMIKFGCSQRKFILQSPPDDEEEESNLSVAELKEQRRVELEERERVEKLQELEEEEKEKEKREKEENEGIDWGMGEDADEETDLTENPYAATNNEELFLDDPKKTLRGWFEREGYELQYQTEERSIGQFLCWIDLPIDSTTGRSTRVEALVKGKKKESVIQCALEACRVLDRHGLLRQANHEARKRKTRNWEEEDYYDSDEDNFLDRTGTVEKKRAQRMRMAGKLDSTVETYTTLLEKHEKVTKEILKIEKSLRASEKLKNSAAEDTNEDALDAFMSNLSSSVLTKSDIIKMKSELQNLRKEEASLIKLVNIAKPANLPPLKPQVILEDSKTNISVKNKGSVKEQGNERRHKGSSSSVITDTESVTNSKKKDKDKEDNTPKDSPIEGKSTDTDTQGNVSKKEGEDEEMVNEEKNEKDLEKRKKRNLKRNQQKLKKAEIELKKAYEKDMYREDYSMWVPPQDQSGDGKTSLNDKYGY